MLAMKPLDLVLACPDTRPVRGPHCLLHLSSLGPVSLEQVGFQSDKRQSESTVEILDADRESRLPVPDGSVPCGSIGSWKRNEIHGDSQLYDSLVPQTSMPTVFRNLDMSSLIAMLLSGLVDVLVDDFWYGQAIKA